MTLLPEKTVLAIDPGTAKHGMAVITRTSDGRMRLDWHDIVPVEGLIAKLHEAYAKQGFQLIVLGDGTGHKEVRKAIQEHISGMGLLIVDETNTSQQARERYWEHNPRRGWRRLLPASLQTPPRPVDDFVAFILAERVLSGQ